MRSMLRKDLLTPGLYFILIFLVLKNAELTSLVLAFITRSSAENWVLSGVAKVKFPQGKGSDQRHDTKCGNLTFPGKQTKDIHVDFRFKVFCNHVPLALASLTSGL